MICSNGEKKIIIFGAGDIGRQALEFYGDEYVAFFADNSVYLAGKSVKGKLILSWSEYTTIQHDYDTIVAIKNHFDVDKQLQQRNILIRHFLPDWQPRWQEVLRRIKWKFSSHIGSNVLFLGISRENSVAQMIVDQIRYMLGKDSNIIMSDLEESIYTDDSVCEHKFKIISKDMNPDEVIITDPERSKELEAIARSYFQGRARVTNPFFQIRHDESNNLISDPYEWEAFPGRDSEEDWQKDFVRLNDIDGIERLAIVLHKYQPLFKHVEIETINRCNGRCSFCPVSVGHDIRERRVMSDELFYKIIDELSCLKFDGRVALFSNNEAFLDKKIIERHKYAHEHLPKAKIHLFTNGTLLTLDNFKEIIPYLDELVIDNYNQEQKLNLNSRDIAIYCEKHPDLKNKVSIVLRREDEVLTSRGGDAPNRDNKKEFTNEKCVLPFEQLIIRPDGKVSLCCNDPYGRMTLGDLNKQKMQDVWYGEKFQSIRELLIKGRGYLPHCRYCDTFYYSTGM